MNLFIIPLFVFIVIVSVILLPGILRTIQSILSRHGISFIENDNQLYEIDISIISAAKLAYMISSMDKKPLKSQKELINEWLDYKIEFHKNPLKTRHFIIKDINKTLNMFKKDTDIIRYCEDLVYVTNTVQRYDILKLCMQVVRVKGRASEHELGILKEIVFALQLETERFRSMMEKIVPADIHDVEDYEITLGITSDMNIDEARLRINDEYRKWNARITNFDDKVRMQAAHMLKYISSAKNKLSI